MADNPVSLGELQSALWHLIDQEAAKVPPYLKPDDVTVQAVQERHPEKFKNLNAARKFLDELVREGVMTKELRRSEDGGSNMYAYYENETK